jgi:hypothetical protein
VSTAYWAELATRPAGFRSTTTGGSLYDVEALSRLLMASGRMDVDEVRR